MANMVQVEQQALLDAASGRVNYTNPTTPIKHRLMTAVGTSTSAGTEVTGGSYAPQTTTPTIASATTPSTNSNSTDENFVGMPACTVSAISEWDSAGTPVRRWFAALTVSRTVNAGDTVTLAANAVSKSLG